MTLSDGRSIESFNNFIWFFSSVLIKVYIIFQLQYSNFDRHTNKQLCIFIILIVVNIIAIAENKAVSYCANRVIDTFSSKIFKSFQVSI